MEAEEDPPQLENFRKECYGIKSFKREILGRQNAAEIEEDKPLAKKVK